MLETNENKVEIGVKKYFRCFQAAQANLRNKLKLSCKNILSFKMSLVLTFCYITHNVGKFTDLCRSKLYIFSKYICYKEVYTTFNTVIMLRIILCKSKCVI